MVVGLVVLEIEPSALKCSNVSSPQSVELLGKFFYFKAPAFKFGRKFGFHPHSLVYAEILCLHSLPDLQATQTLAQVCILTRESIESNSIQKIY